MPAMDDGSMRQSLSRTERSVQSSVVHMLSVRQVRYGVVRRVKNVSSFVDSGMIVNGRVLQVGPS